MATGELYGIELLQKYVDGIITEPESIELAAFLQEHLNNDHAAIEQFLQSTYEQSFNAPLSLPEETTSRMLARLLTAINQEQEQHRQGLKRTGPAKLLQIKWVRWAAAAVFAGLIAMGIFFFSNQGEKQITRKEDPYPSKKEVMPAGGKVILKLPDGQQLYLDSMQGSIVQEGALTVNNKKGSLEYTGAAGKTDYHTLAVPRGRQYKLQLPDGTNVWLNAASSITYPIAFTGAERKVTVSGEVYFEVAKNRSKPFRVAVNDMLVTVTGTHFNVNAYADEPFLATTVLEGSVKVSANNSTVALSPNEQSLLNPEGSISVNRNAPVNEIMAWKNGYFHFESAGLPAILRELARWYDVDVVYEGMISKEKFFVIINRNSSLSAVLKVLQANDVEFNIDGKKLTVRSSK